MTILNFQKNETDYPESRDVEKRKAASYYESLSSSRNNHEYQDPNITEPYLAHELLLPYNRMPKPRLFCTNDKNAECILPKRRPSPVRHILPGRFDLQARTEELSMRRDPIMLNEQERPMFIETEFDIGRSATSREMVVSSKLRRALFEHRPKFDPHVSMHLHRSLPWSLVSPAHQTGIVKFYPNVREQIDKELPDSFQHMKSVFIPDVTCFHFREMPEITSLCGSKEIYIPV